MKQASLPIASVAFALISCPLAGIMVHAHATERGQVYAAKHHHSAKHHHAHRRRTLRRRDLWGPARMPPAPTDFGPHFDFPPASLNNGRTQAPYPGW
jgi:hypothetical protein